MPYERTATNTQASAIKRAVRSIGHLQALSTHTTLLSLLHCHAWHLAKNHSATHRRCFGYRHKTLSVCLKTAFTLCITLLLFSQTATAQTTESISGRVIDSKSKEGLAYVNITSMLSKGTKGTITDGDGYFKLADIAPSDTLIIQHIGYHKHLVPLSTSGKKNLIIALEEESITLPEAKITATKGHYSRKNNKAVELMKEVIRKKPDNNIKKNNYFQYQQHEKIELSISNVSSSMKDKKMFKNMKYVFDNIQVSELNGKSYLPFYFIETLSETFYRRDPECTRTFITAYKDVELNKFLDPQSMKNIMSETFGEIDIYKNSIPLLSNEFTSPLSPFAISFYHFYITDTVAYGSDSCIIVTFSPANQQDFGFYGNIWISHDTNHAMLKLRMELPKSSGVNFVENLLVEQEYEYKDSCLYPTVDNISIDFSIYGIYMHGRKHNSYSNFVFNKPMTPSFYNNNDQTQHIEGYNKRSNSYWEANRISPLTESERKTYTTTTNLKNSATYKVLANTIMAFTSGYVDAGIIDIGPVENTISWNSVEGVRLRLGGKTNMNLHQHLFFDGFLAFGTLDNEFKYRISAMYSFNDKKYHQWEFPLNLLTLSYEHNTDIAGQELLLGTPDRLFLSFNRGDIDKMTMNSEISLQYDYETESQIGYMLRAEYLIQEPLSNLNFISTNGDNTYNPLKSTQITFGIRYAHNEKFFQQHRYRITLNNTSPIYSLKYTLGIPFPDGSPLHHKLEASFLKRWYILSFGYTDIDISMGKIFGTVPYPLLFIHHANQNWAYQDEAFNLMNYYEFISDQYIQLMIGYNFNGFIFNRIPLIKKLNWRECFAIKAVWGKVGENNTPNTSTNSHLPHFPTLPEGLPSSFVLNSGPYIEGNIGIDNIFKVLRIDYVRRFSYLNNPNIAEWGIRFRLRFAF